MYDRERQPKRCIFVVRTTVEYFGSIKVLMWLLCSVAVPGSGMEKNPDPGSGIKVQDHVSKSLETFFWVINT